MSYIIHVILAVILGFGLTVALMCVVQQIAEFLWIGTSIFDDLWKKDDVAVPNISWIITAILLGLLIAFRMI